MGRDEESSTSTAAGEGESQDDLQDLEAPPQEAGDVSGGAVQAAREVARKFQA